MYEKTRNGGDIVVILPCSGDKVLDSGKAIDVYRTQGPRIVLKSVLDRGTYDERIDTYFLSAKHGVIAVDEQIDNYDHTIEEHDKDRLVEEVATFLEDNDYHVLYSFVDGEYSKILDAIGYQRTTKWNIETVMFKPHCYGVLSARDTLRSILSDPPESASAGKVTW